MNTTEPHVETPTIVVPMSLRSIITQGLEPFDPKKHNVRVVIADAAARNGRAK